MERIPRLNRFIRAVLCGGVAAPAGARRGARNSRGGRGGPGDGERGFLRLGPRVDGHHPALRLGDRIPRARNPRSLRPGSPRRRSAAAGSRPLYGLGRSGPRGLVRRRSGEQLPRDRFGAPPGVRWVTMILAPRFLGAGLRSRGSRSVLWLLSPPRSWSGRGLSPLARSGRNRRGPGPSAAAVGVGPVFRW